MKLKTLLVSAVALLCSAASWAQETPTNGSAYYIYNETNDLFFTRGGAWGTYAYASPVGIPWRVEISGSVDFTLRMNDIYLQNDADTGLGFNGEYTDNGTPIALTPAGNASDGYTLKNGDNYITCPSSKGAVSMTTTASTWKFLTQAQYDAVLAARASSQETAVATSKGISIPGGSTLAEVVSDASAWTSTTTNDATPTKATWPITGNANRKGNYNEGTYGVELYQTNDAHITKTISGLTPGIYKVTVRGMKRMGTNGGSVALETAGFYVSDAYMEANGNIIPIKAWANDNTADNAPDGPAAVVDIINNGGYTNEGFVYVDTDGNLSLTVHTDAFWYGGWMVFNGISYTYYCDDTVSDVATEFVSGVAMTAEKWYKFTPSVTDTYTFSATSGITYTSDPSHLTLIDGTAVSSSMELTEATTYYFKSSSAQTLSISATSAIPTPSYLTSAGWTEVTSTAELASSDYYYVLYSVEGVNLMMAQGIVTGRQEGKNTMFYQTAVDPIADPTEVWKIEYDETYKYGVRNLTNSTKYMQSRKAEPYRVQFEWETAQSKWTKFNFAYTNSVWTIENNSCNTESPDTYFSNLFIGPWEAQSFFNGIAVAGNKEGANVGHFKIYRMSAAVYESQSANRQTIIDNKGDITELINGDFETNASGWSSSKDISYWHDQTWTTRSWRGNSQNAFIELTSTGSMSYTVSNMPAGTYKVVAAARAYTGGVIQAEIAGVTGTSITGVGDAASAGRMEINTNGVEMPYSSAGGFTTDGNGHNWRWISATGTLASAGNLVIKFNCTGSSWMAIDDVHLYCTNLEGTSYTQALNNISGNTSVTNTGNASVVTCDIVTSNPNAIISSSAAISGAAGTQINNNLVGGTIANMVLYDGNSYTSPAGEYAITNATYYRNFTSGRNATVMVPFTLDPTTKAAGKAYTPTRYANDVVLFTTVDDPAADVPYVFVPSSGITSLTGARASASEGSKQVDGTSVTFHGTYATTPIEQNENNYVASNNMLWLVDSDISSNPFRAYLHIGAPAGVKSLSIRLDDATGIQAVEGPQSQKTSIYNLAGQRLNKLQKGINILNGKKVLIK